MCPHINAPPVPFVSVTITNASEALFWFLFVLLLVLSPYLVVREWRSMQRENQSPWSALALAVFFAGFVGGFFLIIGIVDPFGRAALSWYEASVDSLQAHQCATTMVAHTYAQLSHTEDVLQAIGVGSIAVGIVVLFTSRFLEHVFVTSASSAR
jgi:uncharacterized membrane protein YfcA